MEPCIFSFYNVTYIIGRSVDKVDFVIDSNTYIQSACISRCHARIVRQAGNQHRLYDDSLNGVFVNNIKIAGKFGLLYESHSGKMGLNACA